MAASLSEVLSFGRYEPLFRVAAGGMAEVYAARIRGEAGFEKLVAVKRMLPHLADDPGFVEMFLDEARLAARIDSPFVVSTLDLGRSEDGTLYMVMDFVLGLPLLELMKTRADSGGVVPIPVAVEILAQVARGLDDAHEATTPAGDPLGLIHRDVSPHNILLGVDGRARIGDFGVARALRRSQERTQAGQIKGKVGYMSPEQTRQELLDRRSDIFSLGIVAWELVTGRRLFDAVDVFDILRGIRETKVPSPQIHNPAVPASLAEVIDRALRKQREARYATAGEMAKALRRVGHELGEAPDPKEVGRFVIEAGGEPLEKLRELIRLSNEGADAARLEQAAPAGTVVIRTPEARGEGGGSELRPGTRRVEGTAKMRLPPGPPPKQGARGTRELERLPPEPPAGRPGDGPRVSTRPLKNPGPSEREREVTRPIPNPTPGSSAASPAKAAREGPRETTRPIKNPTAGASETASETRVLRRKGSTGRPSEGSIEELPASRRGRVSSAGGSGAGVSSAGGSGADDPSESAPTEVFSRSEELERGLLLPPRDLKLALDRSGAADLDETVEQPLDDDDVDETVAEAIPNLRAAPRPASRASARPGPADRPSSHVSTERVRARPAPTRPYLAWAFAAVAFLSLLLAGYALYRVRTSGSELPQDTLPE